MSQRKAKERRRLEREMQERHIVENREWLRGFGQVEVKAPAAAGYVAATSVIKSEQAMALLELGVIVREGDFFRALDRETFARALELNSDAAICDFCSSDQPVWSYPCEDQPVAVDVRPDLNEVWTHASLGAWCACEDCAELIEKGAQQELAERSAQTLAAKMDVTDPSERGMLGGAVLTTQAAFWHGRRGERIAI